MAKKLKAPSGLGITRKGKNFTFSWKLGKNHTDQQLRYRIINGKKAGKWVNYPAGKIKEKTTSVTVAINLSKKFTKIQFEVKGVKGRKSTDWVSYSKAIQKPPIPVGSAVLQSEFATKFSWSIPADDTKWDICTGYKYEHILVQSLNSNHGSKADWKKPSKGSGSSLSGTLTLEERGWTNRNYSYTRLLRVIAVGPAGFSVNAKTKKTTWRYLKHVYSRSLMATNVKAQLLPKKSGGSNISVDWTTNSSYAKPVDKVTVQYLITEPDTIVTEVDDKKVTELVCPTGGSWVSINDIGKRKGNRGISFPITNDIGENKVIFVRVNTLHDADTSMVEGYPVLVTDSLQNLSVPTGLKVTESDPGTRRFTVSANDTTNISGSFMEILYRTTSDQSSDRIVGIIPAGSKSITCQLPEWPSGDSVSLGVRSCVGNYSPIVPDEGETSYVVEPLMRSDIVWDGGSVPLPPSDVTPAQLTSTSIQVTWKWSWAEATGAELSWSENMDAWESTNAPSTYEITNVHASRWIISGLSVGTWYVRLRLFKDVGEARTYGTYSAVFPVKLSASPDTPSLLLADGVVPETGTITCYWAYTSNDGTGQLQADITEAFIDGDNITYSDPPLASTNTSQHLSMKVSDLDWHAGDDPHYLVVRVTSISGETSDGWSKPVSVTIADKVQASFSETSLVLVNEEKVNDEGEPFTDTHYELNTLPLTATALGAGEGGITRYIIERNGSYHPDRPDGLDYQGYDKETIAIKTMPETNEQTGESQVSFDLPDLIGRLDDGAEYTLIAEAVDAYGQSNTISRDFRVKWGHPAVDPTALVEPDRENFVTFITPIMPESGYAEGDTCDIYRLSADLPELLVENAQFGVKYVDPYPTLGQFGGHRVVYKTKYGDYITAENGIGWEDYTADDPEYKMDVFGIVIDFDDEQLILPYDVTVSTNWSKDFTETKYLGGTIQGDWNPGVSRAASLTTNIPIEYNPENIEAVRRLAVYPGACHVRTPDGSSYTANVEVKEDREEKMINRLAKISLDITRIDQIRPDGLTYTEWNMPDEG